METSMWEEDPLKILLGVEGRVLNLFSNSKLECVFRVFDQYEIKVEITKHRHSYLNTGNETPPEVDFQEFGLWDAIFNLGKSLAINHQPFILYQFKELYQHLWGPRNGNLKRRIWKES